jgi:hypothetical protein
VKKEPAASMLARMRKEASYNANGEDKKPANDYDYQILCHRNAFLYLITGEDAYAKASREAVEWLLSYKAWGNPKIKGLSLYTTAMYVSLSYDYCHGAPSWDKEFRDRVSKELFRQHDVIFTSGGTEQNRSPASNWQGLRWSSAGLALLATDEPTDESRLEACHQRVRTYLNENLGENQGSRGWNIEGLGYTFYPMGGAVTQYILAAKRRGPDFDLTSHPGLRMTFWTIYAALCKSDQQLFRPDFSDDNPNAVGEGCYGFAFALCPPELLPGIKWWYDRTVGHLGDKTFDNVRFGSASSILYYPENIEAREPHSIPQWLEAFVDTEGNGFQTYRRLYRDEKDIVAQIYAKLRGSKGHNGPDALSFRIAGMGTLWATGGGRYGPKTNGLDVYTRSMNTLYPVDPDEKFPNNGNSGKIIGTPVINPDGSGHCVMRIGQNNVGTKNHTRRFISSFNSGANAAFIVSDTSDDGRFWQLATIGANEVKADGNTFTITSPDGHSLKGTVLYPAKVEIKTGSRPRGTPALGSNDNKFLHFSSGDGDYLVAMTIVEKGRSHPAVDVRGTWSGEPKGDVLIGRFQAHIEGDTITTKLRQ